MKRFIIHKEDSLRRLNAQDYINNLDPRKKWRVEITEYRERRSLDQNAYIHGVPLKMISDETGYSMEDIKEYLCGEFTGWREVTVFGKAKAKPFLTTSQMDKKQMTDFIEWLQWWASETLNMNIPSPNEMGDEDD
jgi:hypothetical protein